MILQALCDYYDRKAADPESGIAPPGFEWKEIPFIIVIDGEGRFVTIEGANHASFGDYGPQAGDGERTISTEQMRAEVTAVLGDLLG